MYAILLRKRVWQLDFFEGHNYLRKFRYLIEIKLLSSQPGISIYPQHPKATQNFQKPSAKILVNLEWIFPKRQTFPTLYGGWGWSGVLRHRIHCFLFSPLFLSQYNSDCCLIQLYHINYFAIGLDVQGILYNFPSTYEQTTCDAILRNL